VWTFGLLKEAATLDIACPDTCECLQPPFEPLTSRWIHPCYNQPRVSRSKFRLETIIVQWCGYVLVVLVWFCLIWNSFPINNCILTLLPLQPYRYAVVSRSQTLFFFCGGMEEKGLVNLVYHRRWPIPRFWGLNCAASVNCWQPFGVLLLK